jgi:hypothetical protein
MEKEKEVMCELQSPDTPIANPWWRSPCLADDREMTATISANGERTELNMNVLKFEAKRFSYIRPASIPPKSGPSQYTYKNT